MIPSLRHWLHRRRHPQRYAQLGRLLDIPERPELLARQCNAFADMARYAATHTAYYAEHYGDLSAWDGRPDALPILTKEAVRRHLDELLNRDAERSRISLGYTGGSTGQPLAFWYDDSKHELMRAGMMRGFMMSGWRPGQKILYLWGARQDTARGGVFGHQVFGQQLADAIAGERTVAATEYSEARLSEWSQLIQRWRPTLLYGYASALTELARYVVDQRAAMPGSLIGVYSTAEMLHDDRRSLMQQAFGCQVFNQYGCREVPNIAWECQQGGMHVMADLVQLESVARDGEERLLVTSLTNRLMPFIRYDLGDAGRLLDAECACGSPFPLMEMGMCRHNDLIRTPDGRRVHPALFNRLLYGLTQIRQYQWRQVALDRMALDLVCNECLGESALTGLRDTLSRQLALSLEVNYVEVIPRTVSGKHRFIIGLE